MKIRSWLLLSCVCLWIAPQVGGANSVIDLIEYFPTGQINWTKGEVTAKAAVLQQEKGNMDPEDIASGPSYQRAVHNVYDTLLELRLDNRQCAGNLLSNNGNTQAKIEGMAAASKIVQIDSDPSGDGVVHVQMSLYGGFSQLILPSEIRQVQPIKPLNGKVYQNPAFNSSSDTLEQSAYTGLIVDARGTGAKPSMVPRLIDEKGHEIFGPAYVSREFAVLHGICQYIRLAHNPWPELPRVSPRPLVVKGLRTDKPGSCHIVISNADASKLRGTSFHLKFLKQCRVVIVLD